MPPDIQFPEVEPQYIFERDCLEFPAKSDGKRVTCVVTAEFLMAQFGARGFTEEVVRRAFEEHKSEIHAIAQAHIANGWVDQEGYLILTTRFTRLTVTFGEKLKGWQQGEGISSVGNKILVELIGPNAEEVNVLWDREPTMGMMAVILQIDDFSIPHTTKVIIDPREFTDQIALRQLLASVWGAVLKRRSHKYILKSG